VASASPLTELRAEWWRKAGDFGYEPVVVGGLALATGSPNHTPRRAGG